MDPLEELANSKSERDAADLRITKAVASALDAGHTIEEVAQTLRQTQAFTRLYCIRHHIQLPDRQETR